MNHVHKSVHEHVAIHSWTQPLKMSTGCWGQRLMQTSRAPPGQSLRPPELVVVTGPTVVVTGELIKQWHFCTLSSLETYLALLRPATALWKPAL